MHDMIALVAAAVVIAAVWLAMRRGRVAPRDAQRLVADGAQLLDVRTAQEFEDGHLPGARNLPLHDVRQDPLQAGALDRPQVIYCRSGARSAMAARRMRNAGFVHVFDLGPMAAWPVTPAAASIDGEGLDQSKLGDID